MLIEQEAEDSVLEIASKVGIQTSFYCSMMTPVLVSLKFTKVHKNCNTPSYLDFCGPFVDALATKCEIICNLIKYEDNMIN
jgi:hypothetical protein